MGAFTSWVRGRKALASTVALAVIASVPVTFALLHPGFPVTDVDLKAQDVWVTNGQKLLGGRLNHQIGELDAKVNGASDALDVLQDGGATMLTDTTQGSVQIIDPSFVSLTEKISVPAGAQLSYGADTLAVLSDQGTLWVLDATNHLKFDQAKTPVAAKLGTDAQAVVSKSGKVFAVSPSQKKLYSIDHPGAAATSAAFPRLKDYQLSAVGDHPVALDTKANTLVGSDGSAHELPARGIRIQQAGPDNDYALVATGDALIKAPLNGGDATTVPADIKTPMKSTKDVSAPVFLNGCAYGAWAGAQKYLYACDDKPAAPQDIDQPTQGNELRFRVNHGVIALNNLQDGNAWIVSSNMRLVNNWAQVNPDEVTKDGETGKERPVKQSFSEMIANRTAVNHPPVAVDDNFGVRPARTTLLPVLSNDTDPDGDVLTIAKVDDIPAAQGTIDVIDGGRALQLTPTENQASTVSFRYTVTDGRQAFASAQVNVTVRPIELNDPPVATRTSTATVEVGQSIQYNVLNDWIDPDGDDIYLVGAASTTSDAVQFTPDGFVTFTSKTGQAGSKEVKFTISDGRITATGSLMVDVKPAGTLDPVAVPDSATTFAGEPVVIHPLSNDLSPSGNTLSLVGAKLEGSGNATVTSDQAKSTVTLKANTAGPIYLKYTLGAGSRSTDGLILVNVTDPPTTKLPPVAVKDIAYVRPGEPTTVNVLDNDVSPSGRVLVVQSVAKGSDASALNVEVLANSVVRVTAPGVLAEQVQLSYTVSDGYKTSTAGVTVVPIPPLVEHQPPVANDDTVTVRAGDIATVPVLDNDISPDNEPFTLDPVLKDVTNAGEGGTAFVSGKLVRYQAPAAPGTYSVVYGISDKFKQAAAGTVNFVVTGQDKEHNRAPQPDELTARAFAGAAVDVVVPLDAIDPDGDSVSLNGIQTAPGLGRITKSNSTSFTYQAYPTSLGTDTFTYSVQDTHGKAASGTVHIGVIPRPSTVKPPTAVDDHVEVKPGKTASVPVLKNDSDPNGYVISLLPKLPEVQAPLTAKVSGGNVLVNAPEAEGAYVVRYQISNGQGGSATAFVQVLVTPDAKPQYPTAADHVVDVHDLTGKDSVKIDAFAGAQNPSGVVGDLEVATEGPNAGAAKSGQDGKVTVTPGSHRMAITYSLTDPTTKLAAKAFIIVPPKPGSADAASAPPRIKPGLAQQVLKMNESKTWKLTQIIDVPSQRSAKLTGANGVSATNSNGSNSFVDSGTLTFTASKDYRGPAAITFQVNDGRDPGSTADRITLLTLPITVGSPDQTDLPPTFTPPSVTLEAGEKAQLVDLRASSFHPNPAVLSQLSYQGLSGATKDVTAALSGSQLSVSAPLGVQPGATATLKFTVNYKNFSIPGSVNVRVVSSTRPMAMQKNAPQQLELKRNAAGGITQSDAVGGQYWINPFPEKPLLIQDASLVSAPTGVSVSHTASSITVSAGTAANTGSVNVTYHVQDATKDPARVQVGQLRVTIHDVPDAPPPPSNVKSTDAQATMNIAAPKSDHGKPITQYKISWAGGSGTLDAPGVFTAKGLTNGKPYNFSVIAVNSDGPSAASGKSATVTPYGTPGVPTGATLKNTGDYAPTTLHLSWNAPSVTGGGEVTYSYNFDGKGWSGWSTSRSANESAGVGTHSFQVKARNTGSGKESAGADTSNQIQVDKKPDPKPEITLSRGGFNGGTAYFYHVEMRNFTSQAGQWVNGACYTANGSLGYSGNRTMSDGSTPAKLNGSGDFSGDLYCWEGFSGNAPFYVKLNGVTSNNASWGK